MKHSHAVYVSACLQEHPSQAAKRVQPLLGVKGVLIPGLVVLGGLTKSCTKCRAPRGPANSFILKGFDNFVDQTSQMMRHTNNNNNNNNSSDDVDGAGQFDDTLPIVLPADA